ncbi:MAG TPA: hypothetical protein VN903_17875, partial [Polyangia bacterium]|nr:hypothetical protein [Polyangia bacterium]
MRRTDAGQPSGTGGAGGSGTGGSTEGSAGTGGRGGSTDHPDGSAGTVVTAGTGGSAGTVVTAGTGGSAGTVVTAGTGGSAGTGGAAGTGGRAGTGGVAGAGGTGGGSVPRICSSSERFGRPTLVPGLNPESAAIVSARFSPDELTAYLGMFRGAQEDLFVATRASRSEPFGQATQLTTLNSPNLDDFASVTADGLTMYFASTRDNYFSIYKSDRASLASSFSAPKEVRELYVRGEGNPYVTPDGGVLYFHSNRNNNLDIFRATKKATGEFDTPELLPFNTINHDEQNVVVSPDELTIYFRRWGDPTATVWMSTRTSVAEAFGEAVALPELSDPFQGASPTWISPDGCRLYLQEVDPGLGFWVYVAEHTGGSGGSTGSGGGGTGGSSGTGGIGGTVGSGSLGTGGAAGTGGVTRICTSAQPFGAPTEVPGLNGDAHGVISARFSPDELTAYLGIFNGPQQDTFVATRNSRSEPFGTPIPQY